MVWQQVYDPFGNTVISAATRGFNHEGDILRYVFLHSIALACLVGILIMLQVYVFPFTAPVIK